MSKLRSWKVINKKDGNQVMVLITTGDLSLKTMNDLIQNGMNFVVIDERSALVNKDYVDKI